MTSSNTYHLVKRRYFANLGISPPQHVASFPSSPSCSPTSLSPPTPPHIIPNIDASQSVPSQLQASPLLWECPPSDAPDLLVEDSSSFDMEMDSIFEFDSIPITTENHVSLFTCESDTFPVIRSGAQTIPSVSSVPSDSSSVSSSEEEEDSVFEEVPPVGKFIPPHLMSTRSGFSFFEYERSRRAAKRAF